MHHDPRSYLFDVCEAADAILDFIFTVDFEGYAASPLVHSAVERKFEIIGEALNLLSKADPDQAESSGMARKQAFHPHAILERQSLWRTRPVG
jgi:uncharacterized protein with HEPN domain